MDAPPVAVENAFDTFEEVEKGLKLLERDYYHPLKQFNSQTMREHRSLTI